MSHRDLLLYEESSKKFMHGCKTHTTISETYEFLVSVNWKGFKSDGMSLEVPHFASVFKS